MPKPKTTEEAAKENLPERDEEAVGVNLPPPMETIEQAEEQLAEIKKEKLSPAQEKEIEEIDQQLGKTECEFCHKFIDNRGLAKHLKKCKRAYTAKEEATKYKIEDKLPPAETKQEKKDVEEMQDVTDEITQRQLAGQTFTPEQIQQFQEQMQPLAERQDLRNEVAVEQMGTQIQDIRDKREYGGENLSWKDVISMKKVQAMETRQQNDIAPLMAVMNNQMQMQRESHSNDKANQQQMFQMQLANQQQMFQFMVEQLKQNKDEQSALHKIKEITEAAKSLGLRKSKGEDTSAGEHILDAVGKIAEVGLPLLKDIGEQKIEKIKQHKQMMAQLPPEPAEIVSSNNPNTPEALAEQSNLVEQDLGLPSPQPSGDYTGHTGGPANPSIAPLHIPELSDEEYAAKYMDYGDVDSDYISQSLGLGKFKAGHDKHLK